MGEESGTVIFYNKRKGFGRIDTSKDKYFFHWTSTNHDIQKGDKVTFELGKSNIGEKPRAIKVRKSKGD